VDRRLGSLRKVHYGDTLRIALKALPRGLSVGVRAWRGSLAFPNTDERDASRASPQKSNNVAAIRTHEAIIGPVVRRL